MKTSLKDENVMKMVEEGRTLLMMSNIEIRTRYGKYGYYGYNFKNKRLIDPMLRYMMVDEKQGNPKLKMIVLDQAINTLLVNENGDVVGIKFMTFGEHAVSINDCLTEMLGGYNVVVLSSPKSTVYKLYGEMENK